MTMLQVHWWQFSAYQPHSSVTVLPWRIGLLRVPDNRATTTATWRQQTERRRTDHRQPLHIRPSSTVPPGHRPQSSRHRVRSCRLLRSPLWRATVHELPRRYTAKTRRTETVWSSHETVRRR